MSGDVSTPGNESASAARWFCIGMIGSSLILSIGLNTGVNSGMELLRLGMREASMSSRSIHIPSSFRISCDTDANVTVKPLDVRVNADED